VSDFQIKERSKKVMQHNRDKGLFRRPGSPFWFIRYADKNGRIHRESTGTNEKKLAKAILGKKKTEVAENLHLDVKKVPNTTFHELCKQYWDTRGKHFRMNGLDCMVEIWKDGLGNVAIKELTTAKVEKFLNDRMRSADRPLEKDTEGEPIKRRKFGAASRNRHLTMLKAMFNWGVQEGLTLSNPTDGIKRMRETGARTRFLDSSEVNCLLARASDDIRPIVITAIHTGMRRGEILKLRWPDVDLQNRVLTVQESKSGKNRTIPIDDTPHETLKALPSRFKKGYVFPHSSGEPMGDLQHKFQRLAKKAGTGDTRFHDLRHTFASHLVINGVDLKTVQELLGHSTIIMTMRYSHLAKSHRNQAIRTLDMAFQTDTKTDTIKNSVEVATVTSSVSATGR
jgi:integrase